MANKPNTMRYFLILILFFSFIFSLRFIHLGADPPKTLDHASIGHISDPGGYVFNARNKVVFGKWKTDEWNLMYITPISHFLTYCFFLLFGVGIAQMNLVPAVFSCLILIFVYLILKRTLNTTYAFLGVLLLGANYQFAMFSRIAVRIMPMLFFVLLAVYLLMLAETKKHIYFFLAGIVCFLAFTVKGTSLLILPSIVLGTLAYTYFQSKKNLKITLYSFIFFALGLAVVFFIWFLFFYLPHREIFQAVGRDNFRWLTPHGFGEAFTNFWIRPPHYLLNMPVQTCLASLFLLSLFYKIFKSPRKIHIISWISGFWVISNVLHSSFIYYRPWRHAAPLILPLVLLAIVSLYDFSKAKYVQISGKLPFPFYALFFFWLLFPLSDFIILKSRPLILEVMRIQTIYIIATGLVMTVLLAIILELWIKNMKIPIPPYAKTAVLVGLVLASIFLNLKPYLAWAYSPRFDIKTISQDLGKAYDHMTIAGLIAPLITLENLHKGHAYHPGYINKGKNFIHKYKITHLFLLPYFDEKRNYEHDFPEVMQKARLLARYPIWKSHFELYKINPPPRQENKNVDIFEGEICFGEGGIPRFDETASGKFAFVAEKNQSALIEHPLPSYAPGKYNTSFSLKGENTLSEQDWIVKIDVVDTKKRRILASKNLYGRDFSHPSCYQDFPLPLTLKRPTDIAFRVYNRGKITLWLDKISVHRNEEKIL